MLKFHRKTVVEALGRNPIHPFPARMAPGIALEAVRDAKEILRVLDPMAGSGTVLAVARAHGHRAFGVDIDPLSVMLARVWTTPVDRYELSDKAEQVLDRARHLSQKTIAKQSYPSRSNAETREFIRYWFDTEARKQLASLAVAIDRVRNDKIREALWCAFSRLIIAKQAGASLAMDLSHSRPHRAFDTAPIKPFDHFVSAVHIVASNLPARVSGEKVGPAATVTRGDARNLDLRSESIDLVLTSPPYLNAIDYMRCSKFSLVWMGHNVDELREIRGSSVGAEVGLIPESQDRKNLESAIGRLRLSPALAPRQHRMLTRYAFDMDRALGEAMRVLRPKGRAIYVVGDSTLRSTFVSNSTVVSALAERHGFLQVARHERTLPANRRYLPPPKQRGSSAALDARMRREVVLVFKKAAE